MTTETLITERLIIRSTKEEDGPMCLDLWLDDEMGKYLSDPPRDKADDDELNFAVGIETQEGWYPFVVFSKDTGDFIGTCSIAPNKIITEWGLGYCIHKNHWKKGYATEMLTALIDFGYRNGAQTITSDVAKENPGSNAVMRKLGFHIGSEGSFRKQGTDIVYEQYTYRLDKQR